MPDPNDTESTATDTWTTSQAKADATNPATLPQALVDALEGNEPEERDDDGGRVFDHAGADANAKGTKQD